MYRLFYLAGFLIRQFVLPNPFALFGEIATLLNWISGMVFVPLSYIMVSFIYERKSKPFLGSILFTVVYSINTGITYLVCSAYPMVWLMILIVIAYFALYFLIVYKIKTM